MNLPHKLSSEKVGGRSHFSTIFGSKIYTKVIKATKYFAFEGTIYGRERHDASISRLLLRVNFYIFS